MAKVTGIGGVFSKVADPGRSTTWIRDCDGLEVELWQPLP
jgi:hypothetical protein